MTFIDNCSKQMWAFALKSKDQVLDMFKFFHTYVKRGKWGKLKSVKVDNDGEYKGPIERYCRFRVIRLEKTVPKILQQNGVVERKNRTIEERVKCMLSYTKVLKSFRVKALRTTSNLINLSPLAPLNGDVPEKFWTEKDISYKHSQVFGCRTYVHIHKDERSKLDDKVKERIFLGYGPKEFWYRL